MTEMHSSIDRLEARIDHQAARIDALYALLQARGVLPRPAEAGRGDALFDDLPDLEVEDSPLERERRATSARPPRTRLRVGTATGV